MPPPAGRKADPFSMVGKPLATVADIEVNVIRGWLGHTDLSATNCYA